LKILRVVRFFHLVTLRKCEHEIRIVDWNLDSFCGNRWWPNSKNGSIPLGEIRVDVIELKQNDRWEVRKRA
jgi:hypothetical protein